MSILYQYVDQPSFFESFKANVNQTLKVAFVLLGLFTVISEIHAGPGVGRNGRWFTYNDQPTYLVGFDTQQLAADPTIDITAVLDKFSEFRINKIRIWVYCWFLGDAGYTPWQKINGVHNLDAWDDSVYWPRMRLLVAEAKARNIVVEVTIFAPYPNTTNYWWDLPKFKNAWNKNFNSNSAFTSLNGRGHFYPEFYDLNYDERSSRGKSLRFYQQELVDKVVEELGKFDNVYFEIANEFAVDGYGAPSNAINENSQLRLWQENWVQRIDSRTSRLISVHSDTDGLGQGTSIWNGNDQIDILNYRLSNATPTDISNILRNSGAQSGNKILTINETVGDQDKIYYYDIDLHTRYAWGMFLSGGHIAFYQDDSRRILTDPGWEMGANRLRVLRDIAESVRFWEMSPVNPKDGSEYDSLITQGPAKDWQVLATPGSQYVVYFWGERLSTNAEINLPTGSYRYEWYDVRNKKVLGTGTVTGGGNTAITSPASDSWHGNSGLALVIRDNIEKHAERTDFNDRLVLVP